MLPAGKQQWKGWDGTANFGTLPTNGIPIAIYLGSWLIEDMFNTPGTVKYTIRYVLHYAGEESRRLVIYSGFDEELFEFLLV